MFNMKYIMIWTLIIDKFTSFFLKLNVQVKTKYRNIFFLQKYNSFNVIKKTPHKYFFSRLRRRVMESRVITTLPVSGPL